MHPRREDDLASRLGPRFEWIRHLGRGGHGRVELVHDRMREQSVALKLLVGARAGSTDLKREFRVVRDLSHPNLVTMFELVLSSELECIVLEYIDGVDLLRWVGATTESSVTVSRTQTVSPTDGDFASSGHSAGDVDRGRLVRAALQVVDALAFLEAKGLVHGDLKPENVIVDPNGRVVVLDFGIARITGGKNARPIGTLAYMAPEQLAVGSEVSAATDRYALGVLLYRALHGYLPFVGTTDQVRRAKTHALPVASDDPLVRLATALLSPAPLERPDLAQIRSISEQEVPAPAAREMDRRPRATFVGREDELSRLTASARASSIAVLVGAPGLGKTSVLERFCREEAATVLRSRCYANESIRWNAIDALIDELAAEEPIEPHEALGLLFPALHVGEQTQAASALTAIEQVRRAARELGGILRRRGRTTVVVDDAQWADTDSMGFLTQLVMQDPSIALVVAMRGPDARSQRLVARLGAVRRLDVIELGPLRDDEALALAKSLDVDARALAATGNMPFLIEELAWAFGRSDPNVDVRSLLGARLDAVGSASRRLLELLAVNEAPLDTRVLLQIARNAGPTTLYTLVAERLCRIDREGTERFDVYHDVLRQHLLERLGASERTATHAALASAMIDAKMPNDDVARHLLGAGDPRAKSYVETAVSEAIAVLAFDRAAGWLRRLLESADPSEERALRERLADCLRRSENHVAAAEELERVATLDDPVTAIETRRRAAEQWLTAGELERGLAALRALSDEGNLDDYSVARHGVFELIRGRVALRMRGLTPVRAKDVREPATAATRNRIDLAWTIAGCFLLVDPLRAGAAHSLGITQALRIGDDERALRALVAEATYSGAYGGSSRRRTDQILAQIDALATELDDHCRALAMGIRSIALLQRGSLREGVALSPVALERLLASSKTVGWEVMSVRHFYMYGLYYLGNYRELTSHVDAEYRDASARRNRHRMSDVSLHHATVAWLLSHGPTVARERALAASQFWDTVGPNVQRYYAAASEITVALWESDYEAAWRAVTARAFIGAPFLVAEGLRADMLHTLARAAVARAAHVRTPASFATALGAIALLAVEPSVLAAPLARLALAGLASACGAPALADRIAHHAAPALVDRGLLGYAKLAESVRDGVARVTDDLDAPLARVLAPGLAPRPTNGRPVADH